MTSPLKTKHVFLFLLATTTLLSCKEEVKKQETMKVNNLLLQEWTGSFGGVPAFDKMDLENVKPAMLQGMELKLNDIEAILSNVFIVR